MKEREIELMHTEDDSKVVSVTWIIVSGVFPVHLSWAPSDTCYIRNWLQWRCYKPKLVLIQHNRLNLFWSDLTQIQKRESRSITMPVQISRLDLKIRSISNGIIHFPHVSDVNRIISINNWSIEFFDKWECVARQTNNLSSQNIFPWNWLSAFNLNRVFWKGCEVSPI